ncbi:MAG: site-specific DNA-methyltransferase [Chloroflexota bacterium]|nr:MAG: site-specific DNA-methyltransferase [Chloroflexota bacterium]UCF28455.1 MAG: site-specific DNA-methyltransferase [Chloroflexota bacterium]
MTRHQLSIDQIILGDCIEVLKSLPDESVDVIFADPPYNLQLNQELWRPNLTLVDAVDDDWDQFVDFESYDNFSQSWLAECRRVLKSDGSIWVIGSYHNIFRLGYLMQNLGYWFLNDVVWVKTNPMPNFRGVRFTNAHETLIWACKHKKGKYKFNYHAMKDLNDGLQMRSDWQIPLCTGAERIKINGKKAHSTQKPEALLYRVILSSTDPEDIILDPFFGTGTTGAVAKKLNRHWIGIEINPRYVKLAEERIDSIKEDEIEEQIFNLKDNKRNQRRIPFGKIVENGFINAGENLYFEGDKNIKAVIKPDSNLLINGFVGSIHQSAKHLTGGKPSNGWHLWYYESDNGELKPIDELRSKFASQKNFD